ncbi:MAG: hypothetical protein KF708_16665 [Pirellulales bacterium]|nr:hypothetical protein [Pirellulales bacterium]
MFQWLKSWQRWWRRDAEPTGGGVRVCFLGDGVSGSWQMRAAQIAEMNPAWEALATKDLRAGDVARFDLFCIVKRFDAAKAEWLRSQGKAVVYDVVDPWKQPEDGEAHPTLNDAIAYFRRLLVPMPVDGVIFPNATMLGDLGQLVPNPVHLYHHHRVYQEPIIVCRQAQRVGYEGREDYLGPWAETTARVCERLGLEFVINPPALGTLDIGLAVRGGRHGTLMAKRYKSNVKLANLFAAGLPAVAHAEESSYRETDDGNVRFFSDEASLEQAIAELLPYERRLAIHKAFLAHSRRFRVESIAQQYETYFLQVLASRAGQGTSHSAAA